MVFYFTGTGNSLYIAKQLDDEPISIPQVMHQKDLEFTSDKIGIVAPIYGHEVPVMVKDFLNKIRFHTEYFYMILTYGNRHGGAAELAKQLCDSCGIAVQYINVIRMVDNWLPGFDMEEQCRLDKNVDGQLTVILRDIKEEKCMISEVTEEDREAHRQFLSFASQGPADLWQHLIQIHDNCIGCGICEKVCPTASIHVTDRKAEYVPGKCQTCLACVHACPQKAIGLTIPEKNSQARYRNEHISLQEIIKANAVNEFT